MHYCRCTWTHRAWGEKQAVESPGECKGSLCVHLLSLLMSWLGSHLMRPSRLSVCVCARAGKQECLDWPPVKVIITHLSSDPIYSPQTINTPLFPVVMPTTLTSIIQRCSYTVQDNTPGMRQHASLQIHTRASRGMQSAMAGRGGVSVHMEPHVTQCSSDRCKCD